MACWAAPQGKEATVTTLFKWSASKSAAGLSLDWKIDCDSLTDDDWDCIARACMPLLGPFGDVVGVPRGGLKLAEAVERYATSREGPVLIVDDVWTTGMSMARHAAGLGLAMHEWRGLVAFARGPLPPNVRCFAEIKV